MKKLLVIIVVASVSGCATTAGFEQLMNSWVGNHIADYMAANAVAPVSVVNDGRGGKIYQFAVSATSYYTTPTTTTATAYGYGNYASGTATTTGGSTIPIHQSCNWTFSTDSGGYIRRWSYRGNACKAKPQK